MDPNMKDIIVRFTKNVIEDVESRYNQYKDYSDIVIDSTQNVISRNYEYKVSIMCKGFRFHFFTFKIRQTLLVLKDRSRIWESLNEQWQNDHVTQKIECMAW